MASTKERARWERWYDKVMERMERQKRSLSRLVIISTEANAALVQIAEDPDVKNIKQARAIAAGALERVKEAAAAEAEERQATDAAEPVPDPRSNRG